MGLLSEGSPLSWEETQALANHVRDHGITQFINLYHKLKERQGDYLKWGDEVEYMIVKFDHEKKTAKLSLRAKEMLPVLQAAENANPDAVKSLWRPEYAAYMIEGTPGQPYGCETSFNVVETNMRLRREEASVLLKPDEVLMTLTSFPRLGCVDFTSPPIAPTPTAGASQSLFFPDEAIFQGHPRFMTLTRNIRMRRKEKVAINLPVFKDVNTPSPFVEDLSVLGDTGASQAAAKPDHVYMDAMGFGMGCCCLQMTFQACNVQEARLLYDQLAPLCPIMLALTAASPLYRGKVTDVDCRWNVISGSVDCRTREERGVHRPGAEPTIRKSRYDSIDCYLSELGAPYNDVSLEYDEAVYQRLRSADIDHQLARHVAHLFVRDTVSLFSEKVDQDDANSSDHFENIQSTNWQTMRFKPPPAGSPIGWRVEFRPCEVQITDMENAAIVSFIVLLTRVILSYQLNCILPISKVDENMQKAQKRNAVLEEVFWFKKDILTPVSPPEATCCDLVVDVEYQLMSINDIINGKAGEFPGLIPLINSYLSGMEVDAATHCIIKQYLKLIQRRASGELLTTASYLRNYVSNHPDYRHDSNIPESVNYDLLKHLEEVRSGKTPCPQLLGTFKCS